MSIWIALLRGVNVGGKNILPMKDLRALLAGLGYGDVQTYIQSGNCVFRCEAAHAEEISHRIGEAISERFGFRPQVMVLSRELLLAALDGNPYPAGNEDPKSVHFYFLAEPVAKADLEALRALKSETEAFHLTERVFYLWAPDGIGRSKLAEQVERKLGVAVTARNLRSAQKIAELAIHL